MREKLRYGRYLRYGGTVRPIIGKAGTGTADIFLVGREGVLGPKGEEKKKKAHQTTAKG